MILRILNEYFFWKMLTEEITQAQNIIVTTVSLFSDNRYIIRISLFTGRKYNNHSSHKIKILIGQWNAFIY